MYLNIIDPVCNMRRDIRCDIRTSDRFDRKPHGKQGIRIMSEYFSVCEITPASHDLSNQKSPLCKIRNQEEILMPAHTENEKGQATTEASSNAFL